MIPVPFPAGAGGGGGYRERRRAMDPMLDDRRYSRGGERRRSIFPRVTRHVDQRDYRRYERVSSNRNRGSYEDGRNHFLDRTCSSRREHPSGQRDMRGGDRRHRRSGGSNSRHIHKKVGCSVWFCRRSPLTLFPLQMTVEEMDMELESYMRESRHPRIL